VKAGWKTTEFWLKIAAMVSAVILGSGLFPAESTVISVATIISTLLAALGYGYMRTSAKNTHEEQQKKLAEIQLQIEKQKVLDKSREISLRQSVESER
jgi:hypothetical protein